MKYIFIFLIKVYQRTLSRVLPPSCRFYPSCSEYGVQALQKYGFFKGGWLTVKRIARCHPFNPGGYDPVP
jgi:putative membrane protein insertion efficiency factor